MWSTLRIQKPKISEGLQVSLVRHASHRIY
jgi:hypothetical protein